MTDTPALSDGRQFQFVRKPLCAGDGKAAHLLQPGPVSKIDPVVLKIFALPRPLDRAFALLDPLLARPALVVESNDALGRAAHVRHDEADAGIKFSGMP